MEGSRPEEVRFVRRVRASARIPECGAAWARGATQLFYTHSSGAAGVFGPHSPRYRTAGPIGAMSFWQLRSLAGR